MKVLKLNLNIRNLNKPRTIFIIFCLFCLALGVSATYGAGSKWILMVSIVFIVPVVMVISKTQSLMFWGFSIGIFLFLQTILSPLINALDKKSLPANYQSQIDVISGINGIRGLQSITTDEKGFRVSGDIDYRSKDQYRIFALGGSTTEQIYLDDQKTWTHLLEKKLADHLHSKIEVINAGVSGVRSKHCLQRLKGVLEYHPSMVLVSLGINDWNHQIRMDVSPLYKYQYYFHQLSFERTLLGNLFNKVWAHIAETISDNSKYPRNKMKKNSTVVTINGTYYKKRIENARDTKTISYLPCRVSFEFESNLNEIVDLCKDNRISCVLITQATGYKEYVEEGLRNRFWMTPHGSQYKLDLNSLFSIAKMYNDKIIQIANENQVYFVDLDAHIPPTLEYFYDDCHFNEKGAEKVAEVLFDQLRSVVRKKLFSQNQL